jgi:radical SAM-linked protein
LALGIESVAEYLDFDLADCSLGEQEIFQALADGLPSGVKPLKLGEISLSDPAVCGKIRQFKYEITIVNSLPLEEISRKVEEFACSPVVQWARERRGKTDTRNLKDWVDNLELSGSILQMSVAVGPSGSIHPLEALSVILGLSRDEIKTMKILKKSALFEAHEDHSKGSPDGQ